MSAFTKGDVVMMERAPGVLFIITRVWNTNTEGFYACLTNDSDENDRWNAPVADLRHVPKALR